MTLLTHAIDAGGCGAVQGVSALAAHTTAVLLAHGADPQLPDPDGQIPIDLARHYGHGHAQARAAFVPAHRDGLEKRGNEWLR